MGELRIQMIRMRVIIRVVIVITVVMVRVIVIVASMKIKFQKIRLLLEDRRTPHV